MLACKVIVGEYCKGHSTATSAPYKEDGITQYETMVDDENDPKIYVVSKDYHAIPKYIIQFEKKSTRFPW